MRLVKLEANSVAFPNPETALHEPNGLLALGGDLTSPRLLSAYHSGIFPWFEPGEVILWWSPDPRAVLYPGRAPYQPQPAPFYASGPLSLHA
ncbi:Leu/Phe-tRNA-protein transferase [Ewingella americana]